MTKLSNRLTVIVVMAFIAFFGIGVFVSPVRGSHSAEEGQRDEEIALSWNDLISGELGNKLSEYTADRLAWRSTWVSAGSRIGSGINGNIVNGVYISEERLLSANTSSSDDAERFAGIIDRFASEYDGAVYFAAIPTSSGVYADSLPEHLLRYTEKQQIDRLYEQLDSSIRKIDAYNIMKMRSDDYIYYRSDTKWTSYGAYCVYRTVIQKLGFQPVSYDKYTIRHVTDKYRGDLYSRTLYMKSEPDILDIYEYPDGAAVKSCIGYDNNGGTHMRSIYDTEAVGSDKMYALYLGERLPVLRISTDLNNDRRLLVIGSECSTCFVPFLTQHYSEIAVVAPELLERPLNTFLDPDDYEQTLFLVGAGSMDCEKYEYIEKR